MTIPLLHGFLHMLYCHFMDMKQVLYILYNTVMLYIFLCSLLPKAPLWQHFCGSTIIEAQEQSMLKAGFYVSVYNTEIIRMYILPMPSPKYKTHYIQPAISHLLCKT